MVKDHTVREETLQWLQGYNVISIVSLYRVLYLLSTGTAEDQIWAVVTGF